MSELTCTVLQLAMIAKDLGEPLSEEELTLLAAEIDKDNRFCFNALCCPAQPACSHYDCAFSGEIDWDEFIMWWKMEA
jgi:hypothetical protein